MTLNDLLTTFGPTESLAATLKRAQTYAREQSHRTLSLEHLLLALTEDPDASIVISACNVDLMTLKTDVGGYLGRLEDRIPPGVEADYDPTPSEDLVRIFTVAHAAAEQKQRAPSGGLLLAAIVGDGRTPAANMLRVQGLTFDEAVKALQSANAQLRAQQTGAPVPALAPPVDAADATLTAPPVSASPSAPNEVPPTNGSPQHAVAATAPPPSAPAASTEHVAVAQTSPQPESPQPGPPRSGSTAPPGPPGTGQTTATPNSRTPAGMREILDDARRKVEATRFIRQATDLGTPSPSNTAASNAANRSGPAAKPNPTSNGDQPPGTVEGLARLERAPPPDFDPAIRPNGTVHPHGAIPMKVPGAHAGDAQRAPNREAAPPHAHQHHPHRQFPKPAKTANTGVRNPTATAPIPNTPGPNTSGPNIRANAGTNHTPNHAPRPRPPIAEPGPAAPRAGNAGPHPGGLNGARPHPQISKQTTGSGPGGPDVVPPSGNAPALTPTVPPPGIDAVHPSQAAQRPYPHAAAPHPSAPPTHERPPGAPSAPPGQQAGAPVQGELIRPPTASVQSDHNHTGPRGPRGTGPQPPGIATGTAGPHHQGTRPLLPGAQQPGVHQPPQPGQRPFNQSPNQSPVQSPSQPAPRGHRPAEAQATAQSPAQGQIPGPGDRGLLPSPTAAPARPSTSGGAPPPAAKQRPAQQHSGQQHPGQPIANMRDAGGVVAKRDLGKSVPRKMSLAVAETIEVRVARQEIEQLNRPNRPNGQDAANRQDFVVTQAMTLRLRAPGNGFTVEAGAPETQWIENRLGLLNDDHVIWRWIVTPKERGLQDLQLLGTLRTVTSDGLATETALPDESIEVRVAAQAGRSALRMGGYIAAAAFGAALAYAAPIAWPIVAPLLGL